MPRFMVTAVGGDRPGVIAALAGALVELGGNLSDAQMAVLQGYASMMLVVDCPDSADAATLEAALKEGTEGLGQTIWIRHLSDVPVPVAAGDRWIVSVHGADRPGVIYEVSRLLADTGLNVVGLQCRQVGSISSMTMQVDVPTGVDGNQIAARLDRLGDDLGLSCSMRPSPDQP